VITISIELTRQTQPESDQSKLQVSGVGGGKGGASVRRESFPPRQPHRRTAIHRRADFGAVLASSAALAAPGRQQPQWQELSPQHPHEEGAIS
jgi:hypothetical protein